MGLRGGWTHHRRGRGFRRCLGRSPVEMVSYQVNCESWIFNSYKSSCKAEGRVCMTYQVWEGGVF